MVLHKKHIAILIVLLQVLFLCACTIQKNESSVTISQQEDDYPMTISDAAGQTIVLSRKPQRVAVLFSSYADIWNLSGGCIAVTVGDSVKRGFSDDTAILIDPGAGLKLNLELLIASEPDLVIGTLDFASHREAQSLLHELDIPCLLLQEESLEDYLNILQLFCQINGSPASYELYGKNVETHVQSILSQYGSAYHMRYLFIRAGSSLSATKAKTALDHFACVMLDQLGAENIADEICSLTEELSVEYILMNQPDVIFIVPQGDETQARNSMEELFRKDGWKEISAVTHGNIVYLPKEYFHYKPNSAWADAYNYLIDTFQELAG